MPYARPVRMKQPRRQGTRGAPARGGVAARPAPPRVGGGRVQAGGGVAPGNPSGGKDLLTSINALKENPTFQAQVLQGVDPQQAATQAVSAPYLEPAWQQLQEMGIGGQGSAAANKAKLAAELAKRGGGAPPSGAEPGGPMVEPANVGPAAPGGVAGIALQPGQRFTPDQMANARPPDNRVGADLFGGGNDMVKQRLKQQMMSKRLPQQQRGSGGAGPVRGFPMPGQIAVDPAASVAPPPPLRIAGDGRPQGLRQPLLR